MHSVFADFETIFADFESRAAKLPCHVANPVCYALTRALLEGQAEGTVTMVAAIVGQLLGSDGPL